MPRKRKEQSENYSKAFPSTLRKLMDEKKTTQNELADYLDKTRQAISYYCDGSSSPDWETIVKVANFFDVSTDYLLGRTSDPDRVPSAADELGLSVDAIKTLHSYRVFNGGSNRLALLNQLLENPTFAFSLLDRIYQHRQKHIEFLTAYKQRRTEIDALYDRTRGDVVKEIQLYQNDYPTVSISRAEVAALHEQSDVTQYRIQKAFNSILTKMDNDCELEVLGHSLKSEV